MSLEIQIYEMIFYFFFCLQLASMISNPGAYTVNKYVHYVHHGSSQNIHATPYVYNYDIVETTTCHALNAWQRIMLLDPKLLEEELLSMFIYIMGC